MQLLKPPRRAELALRPPTDPSDGATTHGRALARGLELELGSGELQRQLLSAGLSGGRGGGRLRPAPRAPTGRQPPPELLKLLPQISFPQLRGGALLLVARRGLPGLLQGFQRLFRRLQGVGEQVLVLPLEACCLPLCARERWPQLVQSLGLRRQLPRPRLQRHPRPALLRQALLGVLELLQHPRVVGLDHCQGLLGLGVPVRHSPGLAPHPLQLHEGFVLRHCGGPRRGSCRRLGLLRGRPPPAHTRRRPGGLGRCRAPSGGERRAPVGPAPCAP